MLSAKANNHNAILKVLVFIAFIALLGFTQISFAEEAEAGGGFWETLIPDLFGGGDSSTPNPAEHKELTMEILKESAAEMMMAFDFIKVGGDASKKISSGGRIFSPLFAEQLLSFLTFIAAVYTVIKAIAMRSREQFDELVEIGLLFGFMLILLHYYELLFVKSVAYIFNTLTSEIFSNSGASVQENFIEGVLGLFGVVLTILGKILVNFQSASILGGLSSIIAALPLLFAAKVVLDCTVKIFILFFMGDIYAGLSLAIGPFMLAFAPFPRTRGFAENWFDFLITSFALKFMAVLVISIVGSVFIETIVAAVGTQGSGNSDSFVGASILVDAFLTLVLAATFSELLDSVPMLAASFFASGARGATTRGASTHSSGAGKGMRGVLSRFGGKAATPSGAVGKAL